MIAVPDGVRGETADAFARGQGWDLAAAPAAVRPAVRLVGALAAGPQAEDLLAPWSGLVEAVEVPPPRLGAYLLRHLRDGGIGLCLRTDTAYRWPVAAIFVAALRQRFGLVHMDFDHLELIVHELVVNATVHGNLGVDGGWEGGADPFLQFGGAVEAALADPCRAARRVQLSAIPVAGGLEVAVEDDGGGYDRAAVNGRQDDARRVHGLALVSTLTAGLRVERGGRRAVVAMAAEPSAGPAMDLSGAHVLVVDDHRANRTLLQALLTNMGVGRIELAEDGLQGLAAIERTKPDLVMLDVMMPNLDGYEMCRQLRRTYSLTDLPVIFITARTEPADRSQCFAAGGNDMVSKPISVPEVQARVGVHLHHRQVLSELKAYRERVRGELASARDAQLSLVPTAAELSALSRRTGLLIEGWMETSSELGGDFWTVFGAGPRKLGVLVADFTGHGMAAAVNVFRLHLLLSRLPRRTPGLSELLGQLNAELRRVLPPGQFAAVFCGIVDVDEGTLTYASAGALPPVLHGGGETRYLNAAGPPLGAFDEAEFDEHVVAMPPGAALLAYSDALLESEAAGAPICDEDTLLAWVAAVEPGFCVSAAVLERFHERQEGPLADDLTLVCVRRPLI
ncbi:SpoIIE family protein phosphatase [Magnetospirillum sp. UT-4]|uniref:SpoIIE family protein phosphatase n=1 Tax=Magnetospirillum sp. UT-4 TaxID=2681467 RepID=UPI00137D7E57|nr:SpoIIE family protein phosphatase [Magnetospirillum sp. UT-4]CAA7617221.1 Chemotaxis response regulator protein-glutamate methylesterase [Magnetospirillum sp. UT-4]